MANTEKVIAWCRKHYFIISVLIFSAALGCYKLYERLTMPPPLVYLIPDDFYGPVFALFGQPDGVEPQPDSLGHAVKVPENGLVKIRTTLGNTLDTSGDVRPFYMVKVSPEGKRKVLFIHGAAQQNDNGDWEVVYADDKDVIHHFVPEEGKQDFYYFTGAQKRESMVFRETPCAYQIFRPDPNKGSTQPCGKFLILTPNMMASFGDEDSPRWMWDNLDGYYRSVADLEKDLNEVVKKKKEWLSTLQLPMEKATRQ